MLAVPLGLVEAVHVQLADEGAEVGVGEIRGQRQGTQTSGLCEGRARTHAVGADTGTGTDIAHSA